MAEINNFTEINDNFDTIKTLLNSIRAQGILNTSDVDRVLGGINSKLEKINTEEDINLIKAFLTELKQNLEERHSALLSKFGAIEALFSNLLKNSSESLKSSEVKELFDIVATNLSVFSREVVSQKEVLTDITVRLDSMRSDDSQKKDIIKSVMTLKTDIEHLNNGFDSIVLSLNENFKTLLKSVTDIDFTSVATQITDIIASSNTILSALQMIDKKNDKLEESISALATQDDLNSTKRTLTELSADSKNLTNSMDALTQKSYKIDNLSEKIDASVNIIAGLKSVISDSGEQTSRTIIERLGNLELAMQSVATNEEFDTLKSSLESLIRDVLEDFIGGYANVGEDIKEKIASESDKLSQILDANISRAISDIATGTESLKSSIKDSNADIVGVCERNFGEVSENIQNLKQIVSQLDENNTSSSNAIFSNISDRLTIFENSLKLSLEKQEDYVSTSSDKVVDQIENIKKLIGEIDYKSDSTVIEANNTKQELVELKASFDDLLAMDFVNVVKDLRVDLYAVKKDLELAVENSETEVKDKLANDMFGKYELLISKLDSVEDEIKSAQNYSLKEMKNILDNISSSLVDVISYVSVAPNNNSANFDSKLAEVTEILKDNNLNYIESVRDIVDVIRKQVNENIEVAANETKSSVASINQTIEQSSTSIKEDIKSSYNKLLEVQNNFNEIKDILNVNQSSLTGNIDGVLSTAEGLKSDFEVRMIALKNSLIEKVEEFKKELTCANADQISEIKFNSENWHSKSTQQAVDLKNELRAELEQIIERLRASVSSLNEQVTSTSSKIEDINREVVDFIKNDFTADVNNVVDNINSKTSDTLDAIGNQVKDVVTGFGLLDKSVDNLSKETTTALSSTLSKLLEHFVSLRALMNNLNEQSADDMKHNIETIRADFDELRKYVENSDTTIDEDLTRQIAIIERNFGTLNTLMSNAMSESAAKLSDRISEELSKSSDIISANIAEKIEEYKAQLDVLFEKIRTEDSARSEFLREKIGELNLVLDSVLSKQNDAASKRLNDVALNLKNIIAENTELAASDYSVLKESIQDLSSEISTNNKLISCVLKQQLEDLNKFVDAELNLKAQDIKSSFAEVYQNIQVVNSSAASLNEKFESKIAFLNDKIEELRASSQAMSDNKAEMIITSLSELVKDIATNANLQSGENNIKQEILSSSDAIKDSISTNAKSIKDEILFLQNQFSGSQNTIQNSILESAKSITDEIISLQSQFLSQIEPIQDSVKADILPEINSLSNKIESLFEEYSLNLTNLLNNNNSSFIDDLRKEAVELKANLEMIKDRIDKAEFSRMDVYQSQLKELSKTFSDLTESAKEATREEAAKISESLIEHNKQLMNDVENTLDTKINTLLSSNAEISAGELQTMESFANNILYEVESVKQNVIAYRDFITNLVKEQMSHLSVSIEADTDVITRDIIEQLEILKNDRKDDIVSLTSQIEGSVSGYIFDSVNDLKSYLDIKMDSTVVNSKIDALVKGLQESADEVILNLNKLLEASVFADSISDLKNTNKILLDSLSEKLNNQVQEFITENITKKFDDKLNLFNKQFVDTVVDKYEEVKLLSTQYNSSLEKISVSTEELISKFVDTKDDIRNDIKSLSESMNNSIDSLNNSFVELKSHILNKSLDEAFQQAVKNQVAEIESLVKEQMNYIKDINELCCENLPELTELSAVVKHGIQHSIDELAKSSLLQGDNYEQALNKLKVDIITQLINVFNQISFVSEQEEILDFIQEKHNDLVAVLSHIVTVSESVEGRLNSLKADISNINEKISSILSSEGNVDYVYSLQDLESDIANLRLVLNDMKKDNKSAEFEELLTSTNGIYKMVEAIKTEMPHFEIGEFRKDFDTLTEDIESISSRTNKLLLTSDESYKTLQDNLHDFKLVINDLDERTRNFAHESGLDKINSKLGTLNTMIQNGAKTNQVFNQVFEYLAEWVDNAGSQITAISDKVSSLDDIGQIKVMLEDLKAEAADNSENEELVEALGSVFDKQAKRINSIEAKLDRMLVEQTINNKNSKIDLTPMEDTLNRFLVAIDSKMAEQQNKINILESKLSEVVSLVDNKDTAQLTKKVGGMDKQIAKLNKSIEKIASHVVEK